MEALEVNCKNYMKLRSLKYIVIQKEISSMQMENKIYKKKRFIAIE